MATLESAKKIEELTTLIQELDRRIKKQEKYIKSLTDQLALEAKHLLPTSQRSDLRATSISALTADNNRQHEENALLEQQVALLTGQLAQKTEEVDTVTVQNTRLCAEVAEIAKPRPASEYSCTPFLNIAVPRSSYLNIAD